MARQKKQSQPVGAAIAAPTTSPYSQTGSIAPAGTSPAAEPSAPTEPDAPAPPEPSATGAEPSNGKPKKGPRQTLAGRVWVAIAIAAILLVLVIIFIAENTRSITINFVGLHGHISEALALLLAVVVGVVIALLVGSTRILQLSLEVRKHRKKLKDLGEL